MGDQRMPHGPCYPLAERSHRFVFRHRKAGGIDVRRHVARVEVIPLLMMKGVVPAPVGERRKRRKAAQDAHD